MNCDGGFILPYKALVLDIDGTLISKKDGHATQQCISALNELQERGIYVILATGRAPFACKEDIAPGFSPDYRVSSNGAHVTDALGEIIHENRFTADNVQKLTQLATKNDAVLCFSFEDGYYFYSGFGQYVRTRDLPKDYRDYMVDGSARNRHTESMPYGAYGVFDAATAERMRAQSDGLVFMQSLSGGYDICRPEINKVHGVGMILEDLSINWDDVVAAGDSENDIAMLTRAGLGVAMGDAPDNVKAVADRITGTAEEDGVYQLIRDIF